MANHEPLLGVIAAPAQDIVYWGAAGIGAYRQRRGEAASAIRGSAPHAPIRMVGSLSHRNPHAESFRAALHPSTMSGIGSALKFCRLAEGSADLYARFGPTSEWDTAAGQALLEAAGGNVTRLDGHRLRYNCRESLVNGDFLAFNDATVLRQR
jgi:3'(2'), 5'-bisphosphate nucleotidase